MKDYAVFKGGTSLSKCYNIINRFSEDIDIVVFRRANDTNSQLDKRIRKISKVVEGSILEEVHLEVTKRRGNFRKIVYEYSKSGFDQEYGEVGDKIVVEVSRLGNFEPCTDSNVNTYIADMMAEQGQNELVEQYELQSFHLKVLNLNRTLCEKIMSLVRFSYDAKPYESLANKIRHIYDIYMLLKAAEVEKFFESLELDDMLQKVGAGDIVSYNDSYAWLYKHPSEALIFAESDSTWGKIKSTYNTTFNELVIDTPPDAEEILQGIARVAGRIKKIEWDLRK